MSIPSCTISHNGLQNKKIHWCRVITQTARLFITATSLTSLMTFAVMFWYLSRGERNACKIQACMGLKPLPLRCRCRAPPAELSGQLGASLASRSIMSPLYMRIYRLSIYAHISVNNGVIQSRPQSPSLLRMTEGEKGSGEP